MNTVLRLTYGAHILGETYVNLRCGKATCRLGSRPKLNSFDCKKIVPNRKFRRVKNFNLKYITDYDGWTLRRMMFCPITVEYFQF